MDSNSCSGRNRFLWVLQRGLLLALVCWLGGQNGFAQRQPISQPNYKWIVEKDVDIPMRDGAWLKADIFRPDSSETFPVIVTMSAYEKDLLWVPGPRIEEKP